MWWRLWKEKGIEIWNIDLFEVGFGLWRVSRVHIVLSIVGSTVNEWMVQTDRHTIRKTERWFIYYVNNDTHSSAARDDVEKSLLAKTLLYPRLAVIVVVVVVIWWCRTRFSRAELIWPTRRRLISIYYLFWSLSLFTINYGRSILKNGTQIVLSGNHYNQRFTGFENSETQYRPCLQEPPNSTLSISGTLLLRATFNSEKFGIEWAPSAVNTLQCLRLVTVTEYPNWIIIENTGSQNPPTYTKPPVHTLLYLSTFRVAEGEWMRGWLMRMKNIMNWEVRTARIRFSCPVCF